MPRGDVHTHLQILWEVLCEKNGGPKGLRSTAALAALVMTLRDLAWLQLLHKETIKAFCIIDIWMTAETT